MSNIERSIESSGRVEQKQPSESDSQQNDSQTAKEFTFSHPDDVTGNGSCDGQTGNFQSALLSSHFKWPQDSSYWSSISHLVLSSSSTSLSIAGYKNLVVYSRKQSRFQHFFLYLLKKICSYYVFWPKKLWDSGTCWSLFHATLVSFPSELSSVLFMLVLWHHGVAARYALLCQVK